MTTVTTIAAPCVPPSTGLTNPAETLDDVLARAYATGVSIDAYLSDGEIWISDIQRDAKCRAGLGKIALKDVQRYAAERGFAVALAFWAVNDGLRTYYQDLGFVVVDEPDEEDLDGPDDHAVARWTPPLDTAASAA